MNQQFSEDLGHLKALSICFYVKSGLLALTGLFFSIYIFFGAFFMAADLPRQRNEPSPELVGGFVLAFGLISTGAFFLLAFLAFWAGRSLSRQKNYTFCFVIAALVCFSMPLGTILGVFTIIVLLRDTVKALFNGQIYPQYGNPPPNWK